MTNPNDQAFPRSYAYQNPEAGQSELRSAAGLTMREYFASNALQGLLCNADILAQMAKASKCDAVLTAAGVGFMAVQYADALIAALNRAAKP